MTSDKDRGDDGIGDHPCLDPRPDRCRTILVPIPVPIIVESPCETGSEWGNHADD
jgi:hypothetical protein